MLLGPTVAVIKPSECVSKTPGLPDMRNSHHLWGRNQNERPRPTIRCSHADRKTYRPHAHPSALQPASRSIISSALFAFLPHTTMPFPSTANAPPCCHLLPIVLAGPRPSSSATPAAPGAAAAPPLPPLAASAPAVVDPVPLRWIEVATRAPSQPFSRQAALWVVGLK